MVCVIMGTRDSVLLGFLIFFIVVTIIMCCACCLCCIFSIACDRQIGKYEQRCEDIDRQHLASLNYLKYCIDDVAAPVLSCSKQTIYQVMSDIQVQNPVVNPNLNRRNVMVDQ
ncbi:hypothetical protein DRF75_03920 [Ehrlichia minasensis]|uniref:Uncharacterized protein n=2 Tax=Ehrlichia minasensis TaxID=1242993 RepID=A0A4Q6I7A3_9RICK|nr:hypothetical protein DRF75_03920 [Ehrlichia minasensis]